MKVKVLKHKEDKGYHGMILSGTLYRTGTEIIPQLFHEECTKELLQKSIRSIDSPYVTSLDDFELVDAELILNR